MPTIATPPREASRRDFLAEEGRNRRLSWLLITGFVLLLGVLGATIGGGYGAPGAGLTLALLLAAGSVIFAWFGGDRAILLASDAHEVSREQQPLLHNVVEELFVASGLPKPRLYVVQDDAPNAFATGRSPEHASITVTSGLLAKLDRDQLQGVLAHEMSHIRNFDVRFAMLVGVLVGMVALICDAQRRGGRFALRRVRGPGVVSLVLLILGLVLAFLAPLASRLIQMAISRKRELLADASAVELTRNPLGLAGALRRIGADPLRLHAANRATQHLYIVNPLKSFGPDSSALFSTHPPIETRIRILEAMA
jgi:heat shock protein HtpX